MLLVKGLSFLWQTLHVMLQKRLPVQPHWVSTDGQSMLTQALHPGSQANGVVSSRSRLMSFHEFSQEDVVKSQLGG